MVYVAAGLQIVEAASAQTTAAAQSPQQRAAAILGQWEACIKDAVQKSRSGSSKRPDQVAKNAEAQCASFDRALRPVVREALQAMMYSSSDGEVSTQTDVAMGVLRRHIHDRAQETAEKLGVQQGKANGTR